MKCEQCDNEYDEIGKHFYWSNSCTYPDLTEYQHEVITGVLMGDGCIDRYSSENPSLVVQMTTKEYLDYLYEKLGVYSSGVYLSKDAEEVVEMTRGSLGRDGSVEDYSDQYKYTTISSPELEIYSDWYDCGKSFPDNIDLTPTVLVHWFVCDGTYDTSGTQNRILISMSNESDSTEKIEQYFLDSVSIDDITWNIHDRDGWSGQRCDAVFTTDQTELLFDYMSMSPDYQPPGFEYKFP